ncbi:sensory neuron membrane protein 2-like [Fopius arisanus]|uniref:Sensory neuron membrane protein 2-like n=1 Tax=Fopius arisanus TaxID=64838 RepID=A0A9R1TQ48_9HYME|nr:PREDICTED: sensory neuron membrane protein 2-like [Fopius arisanus]
MNLMHENLKLREETDNYVLWQKLKVFFRVYLFEVTNPQAVIAGDNPQLREVGPFVYEYEDRSPEIIAFIISLAPAFLKKIGPIIHQIFPGTVNIFQTGKAGDIIFSGLPLDCVNVDKALNMICNVLKGNPPPLLKRTDTPGHFLYSLFYRINGTHQGPFTVNRGVKNIYSLGNMTSFKNMRVTNFWNTEACNTVSGGDSIINPPQTEKFQHIEFYEPELCRLV